MKINKQRTTGLKWSAVDGMISQALQFIFVITLARLLSPHDFGLIGMISIVSYISTALIDGGFSSALIRKGEVKQSDLSTVFFFNVVIALLLISSIIFISPYFAAYYEEPLIVDMLKFSSISIFLVSLEMIQRVILTTRLDFKSQAIITFISILVSGVIGLCSAFNGLGVWSLVAQQVSLSFMRVVTSIYFVRWLPHLCFDYKSFLSLYSYSYKLLLSNLLDVTYRYIYIFIIGKGFGTSSIGLFTQAKKLSEVPATTVATIIRRVNYPVISRLRNEGGDYESEYLTTISIVSFIVFPVFFIGSFISQELIRAVLGDKWLESAELLQYLMIAFSFYPVNTIVTNILQLKGRSDYYLLSKVINKIIITIVVLSTMKFGLSIICIGMIFTFSCEFFINAILSSKVSNIKFVNFVTVVIPSVVFSCLAYILASQVDYEFESLIAIITLKALVFTSIYIIFRFIEKSLIK